MTYNVLGGMLKAYCFVYVEEVEAEIVIVSAIKTANKNALVKKATDEASLHGMTRQDTAVGLGLDHRAAHRRENLGDAQALQLHANGKLL